MWCRSLIVVLALVAFPACASKNITPETPKAAIALKADAVVIRINELQAAVIDYCGTATTCRAGTIDTNLVRDIVVGCIDIRSVLRTTPDGWQATVRASWTQLKPKFAGITNPAVLAAFNLMDAVLLGI